MIRKRRIDMYFVIIAITLTLSGVMLWEAFQKR